MKLQSKLSAKLIHCDTCYSQDVLLRAVLAASHSSRRARCRAFSLAFGRPRLTSSLACGRPGES